MKGVYKDLSIEEYHADVSAISRTGIMEFRKSPAHYWNAYLNPERPAKETTEAMILGNALHTLVLEPKEFDMRYLIAPAVDRRTKEGKAIYEEFANNSASFIILTEKQHTQIESMANAIRKHPQANELVSGALYEQSIFWDDPHTGIKCKTRPDIWHENMTVDLKTIISADERTFVRSLIQHGYHMQAAMNREGIYHTGGNDIKTHVFVCVEKEWPWMVAIYILDQSVLDTAHCLLKNTLTDLKACRESNTWEGYSVKTITLPTWAENQ